MFKVALVYIHAAMSMWQKKSEKFIEHISSCKDCYSSSINNSYILTGANTDFEAKIKKALYVKNISHDQTTKYIIVVIHFSQVLF